jgi:NitT/TauT family transport system ATP-binding protein
MLLEVKDVGFIYQTPEREKEALKDVSFTIGQGEFVSLVGPSGCGKSTLLSVLAGLDRPTSGMIRLEGQELSSVSPAIGYMLQKDHLFPWRSVRANIELGLEIQKKKDYAHIKAAERLMKCYGLWEVADMPPGQLSGGMRQRCALIRTLITDPEFLLLDESFSALDYQTRKAVSVDIRSIIKQEKKTALLVTHDISESIMLSDKIMVMSHAPGRIIAIHDLSVFRNIPPMERMEHPEYQPLLNQIWKELDFHYA